MLGLIRRSVSQSRGEPGVNTRCCGRGWTAELMGESAGAISNTAVAIAYGARRCVCGEAPKSPVNTGLAVKPKDVASGDRDTCLLHGNDRRASRSC